MPDLKQIAATIKRQLNKIDFLEIAEQRCKNEAQTRVLLIEPFLSILGYEMENGLTPEYDADFGDSSRKKVDYAIMIRSSKPVILIEAKTFGTKLNDKHAGQLNNYFSNTQSALIGILTNGIEYKFYVGSTLKQNILHSEPFLEFDVTDYSNSEIEALANFHRTTIEPNSLVQKSDEKIFANLFENAFYSELKDPSDELLKVILRRIDSSYRLTPSRKQMLIELINPFTIKDIADKYYEELVDGNTGIVTTEEELKAYHFIKALLIQNRGIDAERISYRDYKGHLSVLVDSKSRSVICSLFFNSSSKKISIQGVTYDLDVIEDLVNYKKHLTESAKSLMML